MRPVFEFDAACALSKGCRTYQEDAVIADFARGAETGIAVLADGMGAHAAGDIASKIVVTEVFSKLTFQRSDTQALEANIHNILHRAVMSANSCLKEHMLGFPETRGMGATLVAPVIVGRNLYWISIGDSPLFLFRGGNLTQLNEDHSMAPQIDFMVKSGLMGQEEGARHPDRNILTSVLCGEDVAKIDCPVDPVELQDGDMIIAASDGLQFLSDRQICDLLCENSGGRSAQIADLILSRLEALEDPDLDNVSFSIVKLHQVTRRTEDFVTAEVPGIRRFG